ncbi:hypothetical protein F5148DRAFT_639433 [Russula earlei]|uniref:Uncharacterized protein n=1 Tax=Russula earlei TaxID=71964 RepID=A0ACC0UGY3_9AGAM|nr:hypothetical protein F5148DRAFT_639433 [Russula earlei]
MRILSYSYLLQVCVLFFNSCYNSSFIGAGMANPLAPSVARCSSPHSFCLCAIDRFRLSVNTQLNGLFRSLSITLIFSFAWTALFRPILRERCSLSILTTAICLCLCCCVRTQPSRI